MNEEELKNQIKQEIKQELKKEKKKVILVIVLVIIVVLLVIGVKEDFERLKRNEEYRLQEEQREEELEQDDYEILRIEIPANINWYKEQLEFYKQQLELTGNDEDSNSASKYIKEGYEEFKSFAERSNNKFIEEERKNANDLIKQYEITIKEYNIK